MSIYTSWNDFVGDNDYWGIIHILGASKVVHLTITHFHGYDAK